jgi:hypothetical protein
MINAFSVLKCRQDYKWLWHEEVRWAQNVCLWDATDVVHDVVFTHLLPAGVSSRELKERQRWLCKGQWWWIRRWKTISIRGKERYIIYLRKGKDKTWLDIILKKIYIHYYIKSEIFAG